MKNLVFMLIPLITFLQAFSNESTEDYAQLTKSNMVRYSKVVSKAAVEINTHKKPFDWLLILCILLPIGIFLLIVTTVFCMASYRNETPGEVFRKAILAIGCSSKGKRNNSSQDDEALINRTCDLQQTED